MTCRICGESGHNNRTCVANKEEGTKSRCKICRGVGHNTRTCPVNAAGGTASKCNNCGAEGHNAVTCETPCNCGNDGPEIPTHLPRACPYGRKRKRVAEDGLPPAPGARVCSACGKEGHKKDNTRFHPPPEGESTKMKHDERACTLCGLTGHTKRSATFHPPADGRARRRHARKADDEAAEGEGEENEEEEGGDAGAGAAPAAAAPAEPESEEEEGALKSALVAAAAAAAAAAAPLAVVAAAAAPLPHAKRVLSCGSCGVSGHTSRSTLFHPKASPEEDAPAGAKPAPAGGAPAAGGRLAVLVDAEAGWPIRVAAASGGDDGETYAV